MSSSETCAVRCSPSDEPEANLFDVGIDSIAVVRKCSRCGSIVLLSSPQDAE